MTELELDEVRRRVTAHYEGSWPYQPMVDARDLLAEIERVRALPEYPEMVPNAAEGWQAGFRWGWHYAVKAMRGEP